MNCAATELRPLADALLPGAAAGVVVLGYGNTLRQDDGAGPAVAERLEGALARAGGTCIAAHQLLPEHADALADARLVIFVDATLTEPAGSVHWHTLEAAASASSDTPAAARPAGHHLRPEGVLTLARTLHGAHPQAKVVSIGAAALGHGTELSPEAAHAVDIAAGTILFQIMGQSASSVCAPAHACTG